MIHSKISHILRQSIVYGDISPGEVLSTNHLAQQLNVSRTPVRDAINQLAFEGLVDLRVKSGAVVKMMSQEDFDEFIGIRIALEPYAAEIAATKIHYADVRLLRQHVKEMARLSRIMIEQDYPTEICHELRVLDDDFHSRIYDICANKRIQKIVGDFQILLLRQVYPSLRSTTAVAITLLEHWKIVQALKRNDPQMARFWMTRHLQRGAGDASRAYRKYRSKMMQRNNKNKVKLNLAKIPPISGLDNKIKE